MGNERIKVYVGRSSVCAGDDMNVPNMFSLYLSKDLDDFVTKLSKHIPFHSWTCYLGYYDKGIADCDDGIMVSQKRSQDILFSRTKDGNGPVVTHDAKWHERIKAHPYLFCE